MKLNLGCGKDIRDGYVNIDIIRFSDDVVVGDIQKLTYDDNSIDEILANDVYEHVGFQDSVSLLSHWVSKLKDGGLLIIQTPNILNLAKNILNQKNDKQIESSIRKIFGGQDHQYNYHFTSGHPVLMKKYLRMAGITGDINITDHRLNMTVRALK